MVYDSLVEVTDFVVFTVNNFVIIFRILKYLLRHQYTLHLSPCHDDRWGATNFNPVQSNIILPALILSSSSFLSGHFSL